MTLAIPLVAAPAEPGPTRTVLCDDGLEELIALRYEEYLARRALQELFEAGAMQALEH
jgi:hypothetical protein